MTFKYNLKRLLSFVYPVIIKRIDSEISGVLELTLHNGKLILDSANANYSYGSLHHVFQKAIKEISFQPKANKALILGFGAGSIATILNKENNLGLAIDGVDVDQVMLDIYKEHFRFENDQCQLHAIDAISFLESNTKQYDYIFIDLFVNTEVPKEIINKKFIDLLQKGASPKASIIMNTMLTKDHDFVQLWKATFKDKAFIKHYDADNLVLFATKI